MFTATLAMLLVCADTTMRFPSAESDTMQTGVPILIDTLPVVALGQTSAADTVPATPQVAWALADTVVKKKRPALVEYSDWYGRRLALHRALTWTMIPLFAVSYYTGERLARDGRVNSPYAVRALHPYAATGAAAVFGVNTVTGVWNLWAGRHDAEGRKRRFAHSILFMIADGGFAYAGSIGNKSRDDSRLRSVHRTVALSSMGVSYVGMMLMLLGGK